MISSNYQAVQKKCIRAIISISGQAVPSRFWVATKIMMNQNLKNQIPWFHSQCSTKQHLLKTNKRLTSGKAINPNIPQTQERCWATNSISKPSKPFWGKFNFLIRSENQIKTCWKMDLNRIQDLPSSLGPPLMNNLT